MVFLSILCLLLSVLHIMAGSWKMLFVCFVCFVDVIVLQFLIKGAFNKTEDVC